MTYTEDALVEQPSIALFSELGWQTLNCYEEQFGENGLLGRNNRGEVVLVRHLRAALLKLNSDVPDSAIDSAIDELVRDRSAMSPIAANEQVYQLLREGVKVNTGSDDEDATLVVQVVDWSNAANNDFLLCSQLWVTGEIETRRPDLVGFVNGLPLLFVELKASSKQLIHAYKDNLKDYRDTIPQIFWYNQLILLSNGMQSKLGTISSQWEHFAEWKKIASEKEARKLSLEVAVRGTCDKARLLDLVENYTLFVRQKQTVKILAKYHQYLGVNQALNGLAHVQESHEQKNREQKNKGQLGVFWHTQGSGKSYSMVFFAQKAFRKLPGNWTFVLVTDRTDLDDQIYKTFNSAGLLKEECQADSAASLKQLLHEDHRFVFTLIQKFRADGEDIFPVLSDRNDIIVITDEAHRSQYDVLAMNMRQALPNAKFIAFTGTPLLAGEEKTREVFGDYVSVYNFADAVDDGATLPLYYENRVPEVNLSRDDLGDEIASLLDQADLNDEQEARLEREFGRAYHIITRDERLQTVARDLVDHYLNREPFANGLRGKAMVVSIDKATAIRMYNHVQAEWKMRLASLHARHKAASGVRAAQLQEQIVFMQSTDMAVVVSGGQGEIDAMVKKGLDIRPHRDRMVKEKLDEKFKDADDPLRIVFVCAMWLTGFDAPSVSTLYLDKPLKNHTLMQTIARANRVYPGKTCGQIVDYINIFGALQHALGVYGAGGIQEPHGQYGIGNEPVDSPLFDKAVLLEELQHAMGDFRGWLAEQKISLKAITEAPVNNFAKQNLLQDAALIVMQPGVREEFTSRLRQMNRIFKSLLPSTDAAPFLHDRVLINVIYQVMKHGMGEQVDDDDVLDVIRQQVDELLDEAIKTVHIGNNLPEPVNIGNINFEKLAEMVKRTQKPTLADAERLRNIIERKLVTMVERNHTRQDLQEKFKAMVEQYNLGAYQAEAFFNQLKLFINELDEEEQRGVREGLNEEELAIFDLLCQNIELSAKEREQVKAIAHELLDKLRDTLVIDWRKKQRAKAQVQRMIQDVLDNLPESYNEELWPVACDKVYQHVFDAYRGEGVSVYH